MASISLAKKSSMLNAIKELSVSDSAKAGGKLTQKPVGLKAERALSLLTSKYVVGTIAVISVIAVAGVVGIVTSNEKTDEAKKEVAVVESDDNAQDTTAFEGGEEKEVNLEEIWGDTSVTEYIDPELNVHFYLPDTVTVHLEPTNDWEVTGYSAYLTGEGMNNERFLTTGAETFEVKLNSDAAG